MGAAIGQVLSFAVGVALSPIPIIAVVLMLATPRGRANGPAFLLGWVVGLAAVGTIVLLLSSGAAGSDGGSPSQGNSIVSLVLGLLVLGVALRQWRGRPAAGSEAELPKWMQTIDTFTPVKSAGIAVLLSAINPKNLLLTAGAAAAISGTGASSGDQAVALAVFVVIGTVGPGIPVAIYFFSSRAQELLAGLKAWMGRENAVIMTVLCLIIGAKLLGSGISGLSS